MRQAIRLRGPIALALTLAVGCGANEPAAPAGAALGESSRDGSSADGGAPPANADGGDAAAAPAPKYGANVMPEGGVFFRLWAPHATSAAVSGDFPEQKAVMAPAPGGVFEARVSGARTGHVYRFELVGPTGAITRLDPYCRELTAARDACRVIDPSTFAWQTPSFARPDRSHAVVYEMHVGAATPEGTFASARSLLPGLADLGVNVVELMPVHAFGGKPRGWGYNPHLYFAPKVDYGSADDLRTFIDTAHSLGIAVWVDFVVNHCDDWSKAPLRCFDGFCPNGARGIHFFAPGPHAMTPWGPRPNYAEPEVADMIVASVQQWLTEFRGDGFRWDSVSNIRAHDGTGTVPGGRELLVRANELTKQLGGTTVAEDLKGWDALTKAPAQQGFGFDAQWDGFGWDITNMIAPPSDDGRDLGVVARLVAGGYSGDPFARLLWTENHDTVGNGGSRFPVRIDGNDGSSWVARKRSMLAAVVLLSTPGIPMLFMGQEFLAAQGFNDPPAPLPPATAAGTKVRAFYKDMIGLRRSLPDLAAPAVDVFHRNDGAKVIAYRRGDVIVIANFRNKAYARYDIGVPKGGAWRVRLNTESKTYGDDFGVGQSGTVIAQDVGRDGKPHMVSLSLAPYSALVLTP